MAVSVILKWCIMPGHTELLLTSSEPFLTQEPEVLDGEYKRETVTLWFD